MSTPNQTTAPPLPSDQPARCSIRDNLQDTLFVKAGAGTGKTTELVNRILSLVKSGVCITDIAAITFTVKAASELQVRIRQKLQEEITKQQPDSGPSQAANEEVLRRLETALTELDNAAISTLHAFAQRILTENSLRAELPLSIKFLEEIESKLQFEDEWSSFRKNVLDGSEHSNIIQIAKELGIGSTELKEIAKQFRGNWDQVIKLSEKPLPNASMSLPDKSEIDQIKQVLEAAIAEKGGKKYAELLAGIEKACGYPVDSVEFAKELNEAAEYSVENNKSETGAILIAVQERISPDQAQDKDEAYACFLLFYQKYLEAITEYLFALLAKFTISQAETRKRNGLLTFHDLLVHCQKLLRKYPPAQAALSQPYTHLLIDEFQDTDPIQIEIASLIASAGTSANTDSQTELAGDNQNWDSRQTNPGSLFFVGDAQQSIYRFRRANLNLYFDAERHFVDSPISLNVNWRSTAPILDWVNNVFGRLIKQKPASQPEYMPLEASRGAIHDDPGPTVALLGKEPDEERNKSTADARKNEANEIAKVIKLAVQSGWLVSEKSADGERTSRPTRLSDICVLSSARNNFSHLESAFLEMGIPYQVQVSNRFFDNPEIRDLLTLLKAIDDPADEYNTIAALRSIAFACGDDDLFSFARAGGLWDYNTASKEMPFMSNQPKSIPAELDSAHPVVLAFEWLKAMHSSVNLLSPYQIVELVLKERGLLELALANERHRDIWRRYDHLLLLARNFSRDEGKTLRQFINLLVRLAQAGDEQSEDTVAEPDFDAVKIMTVHSAKGLEFPIVILSNSINKLTLPGSGQEIIWDDEGELGFKKKKHLWTSVFENFTEENKLRGKDETIRKLYVACTRARDHLVVSLHRAKDPEPEKISNQAELLASANSSDIAEFAPESYQDSCPDEQVFLDLSKLAEVTSKSDADGQSVIDDPLRYRNLTAWTDAIGSIRSDSKKQRTWSASRISLDEETLGAGAAATPTDGSPDSATVPDSADSETSAELRAGSEDKGLDEQANLASSIGRSATNFGSAVHAVLQSYNLRLLKQNDWEQTHAEDLAQLAGAQALVNGISDEAGINEIKDLALKALKSDPVQEASKAKSFFKEVYVSAAMELNEQSQTAAHESDPNDQILLDGYIDLVYLDDNDEFVVVDYKTDNSASKEMFYGNLEKYKLQIAAYSLAVKESTGKNVSSCVLLFLPRAKRKLAGVENEVAVTGSELAKLESEVKKSIAKRQHVS